MKDAFDELRNVLGKLTPGDVSVLRTSISPPCAPMSAYVRLVEPRMIRALLAERDALMADAEKSYQQGIDDALSMRCVYLMEDFEKEVDALLAARSKGKEAS